MAPIWSRRFAAAIKVGIMAMVCATKSHALNT